MIDSPTKDSKNNLITLDYEYYEYLQHELEELRRERIALLEALNEINGR